MDSVDDAASNGSTREPEGFALADGDYGPVEGSASDRVVFGTYLRTGTWAPELVALIARELLGGGEGTLIDVGANIGLIAIPVLQRSAARCHAFEPEPTNHALLRRNLQRLGLQSRVRCHRLALDDAAGWVRLSLCADNSGDHRLAHGQRTNSRPTIGVQAAALDDVLAGQALTAPVVMKLDCQGAEARVLSGARRMLDRIDYLVLEYWPAGLLRMGDSVEALQRALRAFPYATLLPPLGRTPPRLQPTDALFASLAWIPRDGSDEGFFDLLLSKRPELPAGRPALAR